MMGLKDPEIYKTYLTNQIWKGRKLEKICTLYMWGGWYDDGMVVGVMCAGGDRSINEVIMI